MKFSLVATFPILFPDLLPLIVAQMKAIRPVCNVGYRDHNTSLFKNLKVLKFEDIVKYKVCMLLFKTKKMVITKKYTVFVYFKYK